MIWLWPGCLRIDWTVPVHWPAVGEEGQTLPTSSVALKLAGSVCAFQYRWVYLGCSGVTRPDSVSVLLLIILAFSVDSVSLRVGFDQMSSFDSNDSLEAIDPEFSFDWLSKGKMTKSLRCSESVFRKLPKLMWRMMTHLLLSVWFFCLVRGTGVGSSGFISVLLNSTSPVVSRFFTVTHNKS